MNELIAPELFIEVIQNAPVRDEGLRPLLHPPNDLRHFQRWKEYPEGSNGEDDYKIEHGDSEPRGVIGSGGTKDSEEGKRSIIPGVPREDTKKVFQICNAVDDFMFLDHFLDELVSQSWNNWKGTEQLVDPRACAENSESTRCLFHCHRKSFMSS
jgi:hypothetical protein